MRTVLLVNILASERSPVNELPTSILTALKLCQSPRKTSAFRVFMEIVLSYLKRKDRRLDRKLEKILEKELEEVT